MSQEDLKPKERRGLPRMTPRDDGNNNPKRGPRFSLYWIWGAIAVILLGFQLFGTLTPDTNRIAVKDFKDMLKNGDVDKIVLISNKSLVRVWIKPDSLKKEFYQKKTRKGFNMISDKGPQFEFTVAKPEIFTDDLRDFYSKNPA